MKGFRSMFIIVCLLAGATKLHSSEEVWAWGQNFHGQLGDNTTTDRWEPVQTHNLTNVIVITGGNHSLALKPDSTVWAWGRNGEGQLGDNTTTDRWEPCSTHISDVIAIDAGRYHSLALKSDSTVWAWGWNSHGQLGDNTNTNRWEPIQTHILTDVIAISAEVEHSLALKSDSTVWAWGENCYGQLGDNTTTNRWEPCSTHISDVIAIAAGGWHSLALKSDSTVWAWGHNNQGQLGDNTTSDRWEPCSTHISDVIAISAGTHHSLALKSDSTIWAWGLNCYGQLGDNTTTNRWEPCSTHILIDVIAIDGGGYCHSVALKSDKTVWAWGWNDEGQLGDNTTTDRWEPIQTHNLTDIILIAAGYRHSFALTNASTGVEEKQINNERQKLELFQNYPNPFTGATEIRYGLPKDANVEITVYNLLGQKVASLVQENRNAGYHSVNWDGKDNSDKKVAKGIYFYRMEAGKFKATRKLTILK